MLKRPKIIGIYSDVNQTNLLVYLSSKNLNVNEYDNRHIFRNYRSSSPPASWLFVCVRHLPTGSFSPIPYKFPMRVDFTKHIFSNRVSEGWIKRIINTFCPEFYSWINMTTNRFDSDLLLATINNKYVLKTLNL